MTDFHATDDVAEATRKRISDALLAPFPPEQIENKQGKSYVGHELVRMRLIEATGNRFDWCVDSTEYRDDGAIKGRVANKETGEIQVPLVCVVRGTLTIPELGSRTGVGVQVIEFGAGEDAPYKGAESDAFKRAAMAFGVGLHLYMNAAPVRQSPPPQPARQQAPSKQDAPVTMTDDQFAVQVRQAIAAKDGERFRRLADEAGNAAPRWKLLIQATETIPALDWITRQMDRRNIADPNLSLEIDAKRTLLAE